MARHQYCWRTLVVAADISVGAALVVSRQIFFVEQLDVRGVPGDPDTYRCVVFEISKIYENVIHCFFFHLLSTRIGNLAMTFYQKTLFGVFVVVPAPLALWITGQGLSVMDCGGKDAESVPALSKRRSPEAWQQMNDAPPVLVQCRIFIVCGQWAFWRVNSLLLRLTTCGELCAHALRRYEVNFFRRDDVKLQLHNRGSFECSPTFLIGIFREKYPDAR